MTRDCMRFGLLTIPMGAMLLLVWLGAAIVFLLRSMRAEQPSGPI